jgi:hypothetical protein
MAKAIRSKSIPTALLVFCFGIALFGCEKAEDPVGYTQKEPGHLLIEAGADGNSAWTLIAPDGTEVQGQGDSLITWPQVGEYWLLWEPVEEWHSPTENPVRLTYERGDVTELEARYQPINGPMGTLRVDPQLKGKNVAWNLHGPEGFFAAGKGKKTMNKRAAGDYMVIWESVEGFVTPPQTNGQLEGDSTLTLLAEFQPVSSGSGEIDIVVSPEGLAAPWFLELDGGGNWSGTGSFTLTAMPVGVYVLTWGPVDGYATPAEEVATLEAGQRIEFAAEYGWVPDPVGSIQIDVSPDTIEASWVLESSAGSRYEGTGDKLLEGLPVDIYTLTPSDVSGYITPSSSSAALAASTTLNWELVYVVTTEPSGTVVVNPEPDSIEAPWQINTPTGTISSGNGDLTVSDLPTGTYELVWGDVAGWTTPAPETFDLTDGAVVEVTGTYAAEADPLGTIQIDPNPDEINAPWELVFTDGATFTGAGDSLLVDMPLGEYTLTWGEVDGYETPTPNPPIRSPRFSEPGG